MIKLNLQLFGGRGSSSGMSANGKPYGTEFHTLFQVDNIKFVVSNSGSSKTPMETMTEGRIYVTVATMKNGEQVINAITFYDDKNKRYKQIDVTGTRHKIDGKSELPHTHLGYIHDENGTRVPTAEENVIIEKVLKAWYNHRHGTGD